MNSFFYHFGIFLMFPILTIGLFDNFDDGEVETMATLLKHLKILHCYLINKILDYQNFLSFKSVVYKHSIYLTQVDLDYFYGFFESEREFSARTAIAIKSNKADILEGIFRSYVEKVAEFTWIIITTKNIKIKFRIPYNCELFIVEKNSSNSYNIKELYHVKHTGPYINDFGYWSSNLNYYMDDRWIYDRRRDMKGAVIVRTDNNGFTTCHNFTVETKHREMWSDYSRLLNFSMSVVYDKLTNNTIANPTEPDGTACSVAHHALNYFPSVIHPTCWWEAFMIIRYESSMGTGWKAYFKPFKYDIWYSILGWLLVSTLSFLIMRKYSYSNMEAGIFTSVYALCEQEGITSQQVKPISTGLRIAYLMSLIVSKIIVPAYGAAILAILTVQLPKIPFHDLEGFAQDGRYKLGSLNNTFLLKYFKRNSDSPIHEIYHKMFIPQNEYPNVNAEALEMLCTKQKYVYLAYTHEFLQKGINCKLLKIPKPVITVFCGFRMRPNSPFVAVFNELILKFYNFGVIHREEDSGDILQITEREDNKPLDMSQVYAVLSLVPMGIIISLIFLVIEITVWRHNRLFIKTMID